MEAMLLYLLGQRLSYGSFITSLWFSQMRDLSSIHPPRLSSRGTGRGLIAAQHSAQRGFFLSPFTPSQLSLSLWGRNLIRGKYHQSLWTPATTTPPTCCLLLGSKPGRSMQTHSVVGYAYRILPAWGEGVMLQRWKEGLASIYTVLLYRR